MSFLQDFGGALASNIGSEMKQREDEARAIKLQDELERRRFARKNNMEASVALDAPVPFGVPVDRGGGRFEQATRVPVRALLNENTAEVVRPASWADGPSIPVPDPMALSPRDAARLDFDRQKQADTNANAAARTAALGSRGSGGGSTAKPKYELRNIGGEVMRVNVNDPNAKPQSIGPASKSGGSKEESADAIRAKWTSVATAIGSAEGEALRSIAAQYGMDQRGLPTDDDSLKSALLAQVDAEFGKRLKGGAKAEQPKQKDADSPPVAGAKKAPDGFWYVQKDGKWFKVN